MNIEGNADPNQGTIDPNVQDDGFFDSIIGSNPPAAGATPKADPIATPAADDATKRYEYWQGKADHFRGELEKNKPLIDMAQQYAPVLDYLRQNPDVITEIEKMRNPQVTAAQTLKAPVKPTPPADWNEADAMIPGTSSFKHRMAQEEYRTQLTEYMFARQEMLDQRERQMQEQQQQRAIEQQRINTLGNTLIAEYGFTKDQVQDFVQVMNDPTSMDMGNLVNLYKVIKHKTKNVAEVKRTLPNGSIPPPPPIGGGTGDASQQPTEEESFMGGISSFGKPSNPLMRFPASR